jgi:hypothetical protein
MLSAVGGARWQTVQAYSYSCPPEPIPFAIRMRRMTIGSTRELHEEHMQIVMHDNPAAHIR